MFDKFVYRMALALAAGFLHDAGADGDRAARQEDAHGLINALGPANFQQADEIVKNLAKTGDPKVVPALQAFSDGDLYVRKSDNQVFIARSSGDVMALIDPLTGQTAGEEAKGNLGKIKINNNLRRSVRAALGGLTLMSPDRGVRLEAAQSVLKSPSADLLEALEAALQNEKDGEIRSVLEKARAVAVLSSDRSPEQKKAAIETIKTEGGRDAIGILSSVSVDDSPRPDVAAAIAGIQSQLVIWDAVQNVWYGLSLGSVLLLAAIGLAITFGVMGIINMAHGEMVMLGAYSTFMVQSVIRSSYPELFDWSLAIALPASVSGDRCRRPCHRARRHPLSLRPAAGNAARHLGHLADLAAGGALDLRTDQSGSRQSLLDVRFL